MPTIAERAARLILKERPAIKEAADELTRQLSSRGVHIQTSTAILCLGRAMAVYEAHQAGHDAA